MKTQPLLSNTPWFQRIHYPDRYSEFDVQAELFCALSLKGYIVKGEVKAELPKRPDIKFRQKTAILDLVIFDSNLIARIIIECKNSPPHISHKKQSFAFNQLERYRSFGIPVLLCYNEKRIPITIDQIISIMLDFPNDSIIDMSKPKTLHLTLR